MADKELQVQGKRGVQTSAETTSGGPMFIPDADIYEDKDALHVEVDMPGVEKDGVTIDLENDRLTIYGKSYVPPYESRASYQEYRVGDFSRSFILPNTVDRNGIDAKMKDGVLCLRLPKAEHAKPRKIEIKTE